MDKGDWVTDYTRRGSPRQGRNRYRWRTNAEKYGEYAAGILIALVIILAVILPAIIYT
jgi:hypothetical protein